MRFLEERRQVLAAAREISQSGMVMGTWGNVSMRCPEPELMLITPSGVDYQLMSMEDIGCCLYTMPGWEPSAG
jgi:ribulose-5-phosphate 4-epimerase/fuculose-1-phosphate aldolase